MIAGDERIFFFGYQAIDLTLFRSYVRGAKVKLRLHSLELSERFMGTESDVTLLEADASLMGLIWSPVKSYHTKEVNSAADENVASIK